MSCRFGSIGSRLRLSPKRSSAFSVSSGGRRTLWQASALQSSALSIVFHALAAHGPGWCIDSRPHAVSIEAGELIEDLDNHYDVAKQYGARAGQLSIAQPRGIAQAGCC